MTHTRTENFHPIFKRLTTPQHCGKNSKILTHKKNYILKEILSQKMSNFQVFAPKISCFFKFCAKNFLILKILRQNFFISKNFAPKIS
jgi:hypothetical protein